MSEAVKRTGLIAKKVGMSRYYTADGFHIPVTLLKVDNCQVVSVKTVANEGYNAVQLGAGTRKAKNVSKAVRGHFAKAKVDIKEKVAEFRVSEDCLLQAGQEILPSHFADGQYVDVAGTSIGKGFAGGMKRHNFGGLEATHGVSISHRSHGSTGQCQDPGRVFKGKKMAGHLGDERVKIQNLEVVATNDDEGLIVINGSVPGPKGRYVFITDAVKRALPAAAPYPAAVKGAKPDDADKAKEGEVEAEVAKNEEAEAAVVEDAAKDKASNEVKAESSDEAAKAEESGEKATEDKSDN